MSERRSHEGCVEAAAARIRASERLGSTRMIAVERLERLVPSNTDPVPKTALSGSISIVIGADRSVRVQMVAESESAECALERLFCAIEPVISLIKDALSKA
jgi:hypothetical protein